MARNIYIAGKNDIACDSLQYLVSTLKYPREHLRVIPTKSDNGRHSWQRSLRFVAIQNGIPCVDLEDAYNDKDALIISLEFDKIVRVDRFKTKSLYNIHFSKLPAYRGVGMAVWPILNGEKETGVTLHKIDAGIDTGEIIAQRIFAVPLEWTARDLYQQFLNEALVLFKDNIEALIADKVSSVAQSREGASYYPRSALDYSNITLDFNRTAYQVHNQIRAFSFWEYQLPLIGGRPVLRSMITERRSSKKPGTIDNVGRYKAIVSTVDYDVVIEFSAYGDLWEWAAGGSPDKGSDIIQCVEDVDRQGANGWSAAMIAAYNVQRERLSLLLKSGAKVNQQNLRGTTLLMYAKSGALIKDDFGCVKMLVELGADVNHKDVAGKSVLDYLYDDGRNDVSSLILDLYHKRMDQA